MDSIGDYLYLIILIVAGLSGLLKKKKVTNNMNPTPAAPRRSWEDVLRDLVPIEPAETVKPKPAPPKEKKEAPIPVMSLETVEGTSSLTGNRPVSQMVSQKYIMKNDNEISTKNILADIKLNSLEEAKIAFIYSEIFNRKY